MQASASSLICLVGRSCGGEEPAGLGCSDEVVTYAFLRSLGARDYSPGCLHSPASRASAVYSRVRNALPLIVLNTGLGVLFVPKVVVAGLSTEVPQHPL